MSRNHGYLELSRASCNHTSLRFTPSPHAIEAGYHRPTPQQRAAAATLRGQVRAHPKGNGERDTIEDEDEGRFPAPLILPGDDLSLDPRYPSQSLRAWQREKNRNKVTPKRRTIYVAAPPDIDQDVEFIRSWSQPLDGTCSSEAEGSITSPRLEDVLSYLSAFYHDLPVKRLSNPRLRYSNWEEPRKATHIKNSARKAKTRVETLAPPYIGLTTSTECIRVRARPSPSPVYYSQQLNLDDLLDTAISILPTDAYALLLLVEHDLFEDEDDEFVCGRAYGGSRVAVVSTARYHPGLDKMQSVEREHAWPASHCEKALQSCCAPSPLSHTDPKPSIVQHRAKRSKGTQANANLDTQFETDLTSMPIPEIFTKGPTSGLKAAVSVHLALSSLSSSPSVSALEGLWLSRVCKTASHELGHCFGIDHCVYFACIMQGTASLAEDARQPPYLCPIDEAKLVNATGLGLHARRKAMAEFCEERGNVHLWRALGAWLLSSRFSL